MSPDRPIRRIENVPGEEVADLVNFAEELQPFYECYKTYSTAAGDIDPNSPNHPDKMHEIGNHCRAIRKRCLLSRNSVAEQIGVPPVQLAAFEGGLIPPADLPEGFGDKLSNVLSEALHPPITNVVNQLETNLGERLTALIAGVRTVELVHQWTEGTRVPSRSNEDRLRLAHDVLRQMVAASETPETIRAWFMGTDPHLEDKAPALVIGTTSMKNMGKIEGKILKAAYAFLEE